MMRLRSPGFATVPGGGVIVAQRIAAVSVRLGYRRGTGATVPSNCHLPAVQYAR
jgi:hypothetical protein